MTNKEEAEISEAMAEAGIEDLVAAYVKSVEIMEVKREAFYTSQKWCARHRDALVRKLSDMGVSLEELQNAE